MPLNFNVHRPICDPRAATILGVLLMLHMAPPVLAALPMIEPGQTLTLTEDIVLTGNESLSFAGTADRPCTIIGNHHQIRSAEKWSGNLTIEHCRIVQLGTGALKPEFRAIEIHGSGDSVVSIRYSIFDESAGVKVVNSDMSSTVFCHKTVLENSVVPVKKDLGDSRESFLASGNSPAKKYFQGNRIYKAHTMFESGNWLIGGDRESEGNILIGHRVKIVARGNSSIIRGNYLHVLMPRTEEFPYWSQVSTVDPGGNLLEHNVIRDGEWIVQLFEGEVRYNVICDINDHNLMRNGSTGRVHHNIFNVGKPDHPPGSMFAFIYIVYPPKATGDGIEIYNNIFDGCGTFEYPGIEVCEQGFVKSLRNNVFCNMAMPEKYYKLPSAVVRPSWMESEVTAAARLGYADYNLMFNPASKARTHYTLDVVGKSQSNGRGQGLHDAGTAGGKESEVDPQFKGSLPKEFPFQDDDIKSGKVTVLQMLLYYRGCYTPGAGSPLIDAGDPADGPGTDIGAVDAGNPAADDHFGKLGK